jgi:hypothetical protein
MHLVADGVEFRNNYVHEHQLCSKFRMQIQCLYQYRPTLESVLANSKPFSIRLEAENPTLKKVKYALHAIPRDGDTAVTLLSVTITISPLLV